MRYTLIEMVQRILESMDSDEVSDISGTPESLAVANIIKECYYNIISGLDLPEHKGIFQLDASGDSSKPVQMSLPSNALDILTLQYNINTVADPNWSPIQYKTLDEFFPIISSNDLTDTSVGSMVNTINGGNFTFKYRKDRAPSYYTSTDDRTIVFDSYDSDVDTTLQKVKTLCYGGILPTFEMSNSYIPDLDARQFQLLLQDSKAQAFIELKQVPNPTAERKARKNEILAQRTKDAVDTRTALEKIRRYGR